MTKKTSNLSDEDILRLVEQFENLDPEVQETLLIGRGAEKSVYQIPGTDYVLKQSYKPDHMIDDYIQSKQLSKITPTETPILITRPDSYPISIQKKLKSFSDGTPETLKKINQSTESIKKDLSNKRIGKSADIHLGNVGLDDTDIPKVFDVGRFKYQSFLDEPEDSPSVLKNKALQKARDTIMDKLSDVSKARIYRSVLPIAGGVLGVASSIGDAMAESEPLNENEDSLLVPEERKYYSPDMPENQVKRWSKIKKLLD